MKTEFDANEWADNQNDEKRLEELEKPPIGLEAHIEAILSHERERFKQLLYNIIPIGKYALTEPVISLNDINKVMEKI